MRRRLGHILRSRRVRRWVIGTGVGVVGATFLFAAAAATLARGAPAWWRTVSRDDPVTIETARRVEDNLTRLLTRGRPMERAGNPGAWRSEPWSFRVQASEANAWLNVRLRPWLANRGEEVVWPDELSELQVDFHEGKVRLGACLRVGDRDQIVSATLDPSLRAGSLFTPAEWVHLGRLGVPATWVLEAAGPDAGGYIPDRLRDLPETDAMYRAFLGTTPMFRNAVIKIGDGRRVRILGITPDGGSLIVSCQTEVQ
ncbi:MAG: hypothetical protein ACKVU4_05045 [Phycisphaerales bacterium]